MAKLDNIEELFKDEDLPEVKAAPSLAKIELAPSEEILNATKNTAPKEDGIERREFTRVDVLDRQIELKFANDLQFAKQYVENISLGGLFVKTNHKHKMGELVPIEFSIPNRKDRNEPKIFHLTGRVCRITSTGVGLEFTNLSNEVRIELEEFVRSILPKGAGLQAKAKASSVDRIEKMREEKAKQEQKLRRLALQLLIVGCLIMLNMIAYQDLKVASEQNAPHTRVDRITLGNVEVNRADINSISRDSAGLFTVYLADGTQIHVSKDQIEKNLPYDLRVDLHVLSTLPLVKEKRSSKTERTLQLTR